MTVIYITAETIQCLIDITKIFFKILKGEQVSKVQRQVG